MGCTINTSFCWRVTFSMRSPVAMSNGCAPVWASYSAINLLTSSMSAVSGSYSRSVVSPRGENVTILAFMFGPPWNGHLRPGCGKIVARFESLKVILHLFAELSRRQFHCANAQKNFVAASAATVESPSRGRVLRGKVSTQHIKCIRAIPWLHRLSLSGIIPRSRSLVWSGAELAREHEVSEATLYAWKSTLSH